MWPKDGRRLLQFCFTVFAPNQAKVMSAIWFYRSGQTLPVWMSCRETLTGGYKSNQLRNLAICAFVFQSLTATTGESQPSTEHFHATPHVGMPRNRCRYFFLFFYVGMVLVFRHGAWSMEHCLSKHQTWWTEAAVRTRPRQRSAVGCRKNILPCRGTAVFIQWWKWWFKSNLSKPNDLTSRRRRGPGTSLWTFRVPVEFRPRGLGRYGSGSSETIAFPCFPKFPVLFHSCPHPRVCALSSSK